MQLVLFCQICWARRHSAAAQWTAHLRHKIVGAADGVEGAVVEQVVLQGHRALGGASHIEALALGAPHPVCKLHHVGHRGRQQDQVHVRRQHDDHLRTNEELSNTEVVLWWPVRKQACRKCMPVALLTAG